MSFHGNSGHPGQQNREESWRDGMLEIQQSAIRESCRGSRGGRGYRGYRGYHGRGRGRGSGERRGGDGEKYDDGSRNGRPPAGLRGKDIGMWYAERSKAKGKQRDLDNRQFIQIDRSKERHLLELLNGIRSRYEVAAQPLRSYRVPDDEDDDDSDDDRGISGQVDGFEHHSDSWSSGGSLKDSKQKAMNAEASTSEAWEGFTDTSPTNASSSAEARSARSSSHGSQHEMRNREDDEEMVVLSSWEDAAAEAGPQAAEEADDSDDDVYPCSLHLNLAMAEGGGEGSEFIREFLNHNAANRRSTERLQDLGKQDVEMRRIEELDTRLKTEMKRKKKEQAYIDMQAVRQKLPSYTKKKKVPTATLR